MKTVRKIIQIDEELCDGCGECVPSCAEGAIEIVDGKARLVAEKYCDGLGACLGECPNGALSIIKRESDDFDEEAVEEYLKEKSAEPAEPYLAHGCPSTRLQSFAPQSACQKANIPSVQSSGGSELSHWPVQIHLVPPSAPFLKGADLVVAADCTPVAYPDFHRDFLKDKTVMVGCPKFDDVDAYIKKFVDIFKTAGIKSVTTVVMEVPCCSALPVIIRKAMDAAGTSIPLEQVVIGTRGGILSREKLAA
jgi:Fe-S-cluster-containing hydrogenase component 2